METIETTGTQSGPESIFFSLLDKIAEGRWNELGEIYDENAVVEQPFASPAPVALRGREAISRHFAGGAQMPFAISPSNIRVYRTVDPEVIFAEFDYDLRHVGTGRAFKLANVQRLRVRNGKIVESRDYHDHHALGVAIASEDA